jgi:anti-sigma factor RsiW
MTNQQHIVPVQTPATDLTCQQLIALCVDYLTGDLDAVTGAAFELHLRDCPDCLAFLATYRATIRATRSVRYEAIPEQMLARIEQFLRDRIHPT